MRTFYSYLFIVKPNKFLMKLKGWLQKFIRFDDVQEKGSKCPINKQIILDLKITSSCNSHMKC